jgi:hypothetical protein
MIGVNMGKVEYNAPEQRLNAAAVDHRADLYPLGVMFHEMLTGALPDGKHTIHDLRPDLPAQCDVFAAKAMAADIEERFSSGHEFRTALLALYQESRQTPSEPDTAAETAEAAPVRRFRLWNWVTGLFRRSAAS